MKKLAPIFFIFTLSVQAYSQPTNTDKTQYSLKYEKYKKMKQTGGSLTMLGALALGSGMILSLYSGSASTQSSSHGSPELANGLILGGWAALGAGIPLWAVGSKKEKQYKRLSEQSGSLSINPQIHGFTLRYKF